MNRITPRLIWILLGLSFVSALVGVSGSALGYWPAVARPSPPFDAILRSPLIWSHWCCASASPASIKVLRAWRARGCCLPPVAGSASSDT